MKGDIDSAQKSLGSYRSMLSAVKKSHKSYEQSCRELVQHESELERYRVDPLRESDLKKAEHKVKKLRTGAEHLSEWVWSRESRMIVNNNNYYAGFFYL